MYIFCTLIFLHFLTVFHIFAAAIWNLAKMIVKPIKTIMIMKTRNLLMLLLLAMMPLAASAYDFELNGIYYEKAGEGEVAVVKGKVKYKGDVVIPSSIVVGGTKYAVTGIGDLAFKDCLVTSVTLPEGLKRIGYMGLSVFCANVNIPSTLEEIGMFGLAGVQMEHMTLPEGLRVIGDYAFEHCRLTDVVIPSSVTEIGVAPFMGAGCNSDNGIINGLDFVKVAEDNPRYDSRDGCNAIIETSTGKLVQGSNNAVIPAGVSSIGYGAFLMCRQIAKLSVPAEVKEIESDCFAMCYGIQDVFVYSNEPASTFRAFGDPRGAFHFDEVVLHVPVGSKDAYAASGSWSYFKHIEEFDPENEASPTGIGVAETGVAGVEACFSADGKRLQAPVRGLNIVRMSDGTTKKVVMK